ncbi:NGK_0946 family protein [Neisseria weaveri]|uniref:NGK_0946 family protein n=1 Tax=Neisseria weaveri TaxID=28091 RepID=UPI003989FF73
MSIMKKIAAALLVASTLAACASPNSVGNLAIGDDSMAINAGRNRAEAQVSRAQLEQHRRQRANTSEELALEREKRRNKHEGMRETMGTTAGALGILNGIVGTITHIKHAF